MNCNVNIIPQNYGHVRGMVDTWYTGLYVVTALVQGKAVIILHIFTPSIKWICLKCGKLMIPLPMSDVLHVKAERIEKSKKDWEIRKFDLNRIKLQL